jgi:hypothetical protein
MSDKLKKRLEQLEKNQPSILLDDGLPPGVKAWGFEWFHRDPEICSKLPKRGYCGEKVHIYMYNSADSIKVFDGKTNMKLIKCGWCSHFLKTCNGANYHKFDLEDLKRKICVETSS